MVIKTESGHIAGNDHSIEGNESYKSSNHQEDSKSK